MRQSLPAQKISSNTQNASGLMASSASMTNQRSPVNPSYSSKAQHNAELITSPPSITQQSIASSNTQHNAELVTNSLSMEHQSLAASKTQHNAELIPKSLIDISETISDKCYDYLYKVENSTAMTILALTIDNISKINKIIQKFTPDYWNWSYCKQLIENRLDSILVYNNILEEIKIAAEFATSIDDLNLSLIEIMNVIDNIDKEIDFFEILSEVLELENTVKRYWYAKILKSQKKIDDLKSEFNIKLKDLEYFCASNIGNLNTIENEKFMNLTDELYLISKLMNNNAEAKYFLQIKNDQLVINVTEAWEWSCFSLSILKYTYYLPKHEYPVHDTQVIELPNSEIFCFAQSSLAFKIDLKSFRIGKLFRAFRGCNHSTPIYYKNCVYVFSMESKYSRKSILEKYDLIKGLKTFFISPLKTYSNDSLCCLYKDSILFCASKISKLWKFDFLLESYSEFPFYGICLGYMKMLFTVNNRAYIVDSENVVFGSEIDNEYNWSKIAKFSGISYKEYNNHRDAEWYIFANMEQGSIKIYQFDFKNKKIYEPKSNWYGSINIK